MLRNHEQILQRNELQSPYAESIYHVNYPVPSACPSTNNNNLRLIALLVTDSAISKC